LGAVGAGEGPEQADRHFGRIDDNSTDAHRPRPLCEAGAALAITAARDAVTILSRERIIGVVIRVWRAAQPAAATRAKRCRAMPVQRLEEG